MNSESFSSSKNATALLNGAPPPSAEPAPAVPEHARSPTASPSAPPPSQVRVAAQDRKALMKELSDPRLRQDLLNYLVTRKEMIPHRAEDVVQRAYVRALQAATWPQDPSKIAHWMRSIVDGTFVDDLRKRERRLEHEEPCDDVDVAEDRPGVERAQQVSQIARNLASLSEEDAKTLEMIQARAEGESIDAVAKRFQVAPSTFYRRKADLAGRIRKRLLDVTSLMGGGLGILLLIHMVTFVAGGLMAGRPPVAPLPALSAHEDAATLRTRALRRCGAHEYAQCLKLLDRARAIDPEGDKEPGAASAREEAEAAMKGGETESPR